MTTSEGTIGRYLRWLLAALSLGAGVIHFANAGDHFDLALSHGLFFAVVAWAQLAWAAAVTVRPTRRVLVVGALGNAVVIGVWAISRTTGVPVGPDAGEAESVALADGMATLFELLIVAVAVAVLARPALAQRSVRPRAALAGIRTGALAVAVVSTLAVAPAFADDHDHADDETAHHEGGDDGDNPAHGEEGHDHEAMLAAQAASEDGDHADDHADGDAGDHAEGHTNTVIVADGTSACEQSGYGNEGNSGHGHRGPVPYTPLDGETRAEFADQVRQANEAVATYPTAADAEAAGWRRITPYVPCIAAHYLNNAALDGEFDPAEPEILLYDGTDPDSQIVGLSYLVFTTPETEPEGFAGDNDPWHVHSQLCIGGGAGVLGDESTSEEDCEARGGRVVPLDNLWMSHMWNVPGWDSRWGLFSSEHPDLGGRIGDIDGDPAS